MDKKILLIDGNSLLNRAYFAVKINLTSQEGVPTNAVHGFFMMLSRLLKKIKPTHIAVAFDEKGGTFRNKMYDLYKSGRKKPDDKMLAQFPIVKEILKAMNIKYISKNGYEADDIIGTLSNYFDGKSYIATGDGDLLQLIDDKTFVLMNTKDQKDFDVFDKDLLKERRNLEPYQIIEYKALAGDSSDKIPGAPGIGDKKATVLLNNYKSVKNIYENLDSLDLKLRSIFEENKEIIELSHQLATIIRDIKMEVNFNEFILDIPQDYNLYNEFEKYSLIKVRENFIDENRLSEILKEKNNSQFANTIKILNNSNISYEIIQEKKVNLLKKDLQKIIETNKNAEYYSLYINDQSICFAFDELTDYEYIFNNDKEEIICMFKDFVLDKNKHLYSYDSKSLFHYLYDNSKICIDHYNYDDFILKKYLINPLNQSTGIENDFGRISCIEIIKNDKKLSKKIKEYKMEDLYLVERDLSRVLYEMEKEGFKVDKKLMEEFRLNFDKKLDNLTKKIYLLANQEFNINSPKQLSSVLFEDLGLKSIKNTKTGASTNIEVLQELVNEHEIIPNIIEYREIKKLQSSYVEPILSMLDKNDRIHTLFKQNITATGRLSSTEPNLQTIPVRREEGRELRKAFIASDGCILLGADYSQIELRILAHLSNDPILIDSFEKNIDIHSLTASKIFNIPLNEVTPNLRRNAKAINFGVIYGISPFGLSQDTGLTTQECSKFIKTYFDTYKDVRKFLDKSVEFAEKTGYTLSILNRRRPIPELLSDRKVLKNFGVRAAYNSPMQSTAADIIKLAMNKIFKELKKRKLKSKLILQIHDELIIDCIIEEKEEVSKLLNETMENIIKLNVPLIAEVNEGKNLYETK